jgi:hypothetical protein
VAVMTVVAVASFPAACIYRAVTRRIALLAASRSRRAAARDNEREFKSQGRSAAAFLRSVQVRGLGHPFNSRRPLVAARPGRLLSFLEAFLLAAWPRER